MLIIIINGEQSTAKTAAQTANEIIYRGKSARAGFNNPIKVVEEHNESGQL